MSRSGYDITLSVTLKEFQPVCYYFSAMSPLAFNIACAPSGRNLRVQAGTVMEENESFGCTL